MVKKKAILIGVDGGFRGLKFLNAISTNIENYRSFLTSVAGGMWHENEIVVLCNPDSKSVIEEVTNTQVDYTLTVYCGYGTIISFDRNDYVALPDTDLSIANLVTSSTKQTIIIDTVTQANITEIAAERSPSDNITNTTDNTSFDSRYDLALAEMPKGVLIVYSANVNQKSGYDKNFGSHFSYALIKCAKTWHHTSNGSDILRVNEAIQMVAKEIMTTFHTSQSPVMGGQARRLTFPPFAMANLFK